MTNRKSAYYQRLDSREESPKCDVTVSSFVCFMVDVYFRNAVWSRLAERPLQTIEREKQTFLMKSINIRSE
jgi:hypothetical protein